MSKRIPSNLDSKYMLEQLVQEAPEQLIFSPFVHLFNINKEIQCFFNSLTLKKVYLSNRKYKKILNDLGAKRCTKEVKNLIALNFIVPKNFNAEEAFHSIGNSLLRKKPLPGISYVLVTDFCNFRCGYCFIENALSGPSSAMSKDVADKVVNVLLNAARDVKEYRVTFYGGEPFSNSEIIFYIIEKLEALKNKFNFSCITNGSFLTEELTKRLKDHKVSVGLSLDGWAYINRNRIFHDGKESFYPTLKALSILKDAGVDVGISCTITKQNYEYAEDIVEFFYKLGVRSIGFNLFTRLKELTEFEVPDPKQLAYHLFMAYLKAKSLGMNEDRIDKRRAEYFFKEMFHVYDCPAYGQQIFFSPRGTVGPCQAFYPSGKYQVPIRDDMKAQDEPLFYEWLNLGTLKNKDCIGCPALGICGGACAYDVYLKTGKLDIKEDYFCKFQNEILRLLLTYNYLQNVKNKPANK